MAAAFLTLSRAEYAYEASADEEISVQEGDLLYTLDDTDADWHKVKRHRPAGEESSGPGEEGLVPASYLTEVAGVRQVKSFYDYAATGSDEVSVGEDEALELLLEPDAGEEWVLVRKLDQRAVGYIPAAWILSEDDAHVEVSTQCFLLYSVHADCIIPVD